MFIIFFIMNVKLINALLLELNLAWIKQRIHRKKVRRIRDILYALSFLPTPADLNNNLDKSTKVRFNTVIFQSDLRSRLKLARRIS